MEKVLVIDDDELIRELAGDILRSGGYEVLTAADPVSALWTLKNEDVSAMLLDLVLPLESGMDLIPRITGVRPDAAIIMMTSYASVDSVVEATRRGAYDYIKKPLDPDEVLHSVGNAIERRNILSRNRSLVEDLKDKVDKLELFEHLSGAMSSGLAVDNLIERVSEITMAVMKAEACSILLIDDSTGNLVFKVALGEWGEDVLAFSIKPGQGIAGWVAQSGSPALVPDVTVEERFNGTLDERTGFETRSVVAVPLFVKEKIVGVLEVVNKVNGEPFGSSDLEILTAISGHIAIAIDNSRMTDDLKRSHMQIEGYSKNLEKMVKNRTRELECANTELRETQAQLLQTEKLSSLGQLSAGIAHEINNPIGFISSNVRSMGKYGEELLELISAYEGVIEEAEKNGCHIDTAAVEEIKKKINFGFIRDDVPKLTKESLDGTFRVQKIVKDLKSFSRADDGERQFVDLNSSLESTMNIVWNELKYKAEVVKDFGEIPEVECLPGQLNQVFMNLLVNASDAISDTPDTRDDKGKITVRTSVVEGLVLVEITDTGVGIPEEKLSRIFDPFFTTKEVGKGTGLGLSISYNIIKTHKGEIRVKSSPGDGTTFTIALPRSMGRPEGAGVA